MRDEELFTLDILRCIFGWTVEGLSNDCPGTSIGRMTIGDLSFEACLSDYVGLNDYIDMNPKKVIWVKCGTGSWEPGLSKYEMVVDIDIYHMYLSYTYTSDSSALMYNINPETFFDEVLLRFLCLSNWMLDKYAIGELPVVCFWCKSGCHHSYGMLVMFLMWMTKVFEANILLREIATTRNRHLKYGKKCAVVFVCNTFP